MPGELPAATAFILVRALAAGSMPTAVADIKVLPPLVALVPLLVFGGKAGEPSASELVSAIGLSEAPRPPPLVALFPVSVIARPLVSPVVPFVVPGLLV